MGENKCFEVVPTPPASSAEVVLRQAHTKVACVVGTSTLQKECPNMADSSHDISVLNSLISTTLDSVDGYREAAVDARNSRFASMFTQRAQERRAVVTDLQAQVRMLGGNPENDGTTLAGAHRMFLDLKAKVTGHDDQSIISEVERGEDYLKTKYDSALADTYLSPATMVVVQTAYQSVREGHDQMSALKHGMDM